MIVAPTDLSGGKALIQEHAKEMGAAVAVKVDETCAALFPSLSNSVGSTGVDLTIAQFREAVYTMKANTRRPTGGQKYVGILDPIQLYDLQTDAVSDASKAAFFGAGLAKEMVAGQTLVSNPNNYAGKLFGVEVYESSLVPDTDSSGADVSGAMYIAGHTFGIATKWLARTEFQRVAGAIASKIVVSSAFGVVVVDDLSGVAINTDAA